MTQGKSQPDLSPPAKSAVTGENFSTTEVSAAGDGPLSPAPVSESGNSDEINRELRKLNRALRALSACNHALAQAGSEQELLDQICDVIVRLGGYRMAGIGYSEPGQDKAIRPMAHAGYDSGYLEQVDIRWSDTPAGRGPSGTAVRENRICVISDTATDPRFTPWREAALQRGYAAVISLPLRVAGLPFGVLAIYSEQAGSFESSEVELLAEIADNLSYGVTSIRAQAERKRATEALREAEVKYRQLVEQVPAISYLAESGAMGPFLYMSPQVEMILGYTSAEVMADPHFWWNHLNPLDHSIATSEDTWPEGRPFRVEYRMATRDDREVWIRDDALIFSDHGTGRRLTRGLMIDITEIKVAEKALRESEERYRAFVEQSSEGIYRTEYDPPVPVDLPLEEQMKQCLEQGYVAECNDAMARMYGLKSARELVGKRLLDFLIADDPVTKESMAELIRSRYRITDRETIERDAHGETKVFRNTILGIVESGLLLRSWGIQYDVTERKRLEEQLRNAQQLEAIGRLAGGVAHDFNNILGIIMGHGELLLATAGLEARVRNGLEQMQRASERAAALTHQLLAFSRKQVLQPRVLDLNETVADVQKMLARVIGEDIELTASLHPSLAPVRVDPGQMEQVLMNLAVNARDAMAHGGQLLMETANVQIDTEQGRELELEPGSYVLLTVRDTGHGMGAETLPHVFEPFFTTKPVGKGTGLGLATVYGIVKQSGGSIRVGSQPERGTEFRIYLPAAEPKVAPSPQQERERQVAGGRETILVVEDQPDLRELTRIFLEDYGYRVLEAADAEQALHLEALFAEQIDLLLTDVIMPGVSGSQLAERVLRKRPQIRVIYMTGYTDDMVVHHKVLEPGRKLLPKPFTKIELAERVREVLDQK